MCWVETGGVLLLNTCEVRGGEVLTTAWSTLFMAGCLVLSTWLCSDIMLALKSSSDIVRGAPALSESNMCNTCQLLGGGVKTRGSVIT